MFSGEQLRTAINLADQYQAVIEFRRELLSGCNKRLHWRRVAGHEYLYCADRTGERSLGPKSALTLAQYDSFKTKKQDLQKYLGAYQSRLQVQCAFYKTLKMPMLDPNKARLLQELDANQLLGNAVIVNGALCLAAYSLEALQELDAPGVQDDPSEAIFTPMLPGLDPVFCASQDVASARDRASVIAKLLGVLECLASAGAGQSKATHAERPFNWLTRGAQVAQVVCGRDRTPCRIVAPDPRWFALYAMWRSTQADCPPELARSAIAQAKAVWNALPEMGRFDLDVDFLNEVQGEPALWRALELLGEPLSTVSRDGVYASYDFKLKLQRC